MGDTVTPLVIPTVHLGGTHGPDLENQFASAVCRLDEAIAAMENATPHGRDYVLRSDQWGDRFRLAMQQHVNRILALTEIRNDMVTLAQQVAEQNDTRTKQKRNSNDPF